MEEQRKLHAEKFNTSIEYVKFWTELDQTNWNRVYRMYDQSLSLLPTKYIYLLGINGAVISRRKL